MTNIVGITVYGVLYLLAMIFLLILFFVGKNWVMLTGLSGFLLMGLILSITITRYNYVDMIHDKNMVEVSRTERIPEVVKGRKYLQEQLENGPDRIWVACK